MDPRDGMSWDATDPMRDTASTASSHSASTSSSMRSATSAFAWALVIPLRAQSSTQSEASWVSP